ncbi:GntR family transcriptional regulator [Roseiconus lacunae]|uniref:GntR family transcriptional regulator n=1 Tax=Roseiconus lacunae TaxID=2605694 RepID=A0ABT7PPT9_9BACT|nr:GntR family transcriptional regulator [Roseiconus lacunae]MCD0462194.1 GntR family transcriptional regulator [Roseiconus lacunae]MDM4018522.1 GntR family transcriptional regulator [Roseiconus lacunae]
MNTTNAQLAYQHLRSRLIAGDFAPGSRIRYGPIGRELGISATPVREAIGLLANEGFVKLVPQLGAVVRSIGADELVELYEVREAIETYAAGKAAERASETQQQAIHRTLKRMQDITAKVHRRKSAIAKADEAQEFEKADLAFHMLVINSGGNQMMVRMSENSNALTRVFATPRHGYDDNIMKSTCDDHQAIFDAIAAGDGAAATNAMRTHIRAGLEVTLQAIQTQQTERWEIS